MTNENKLQRINLEIVSNKEIFEKSSKDHHLYMNFLLAKRMGVIVAMRQEKSVDKILELCRTGK